ncbi:Metallopeptidase domain-containing protein [Fusobacterium sp. oral taxon C10]
MEIKVNKRRKEFDISSENEKKKLIEKLLIEYINEFPFFINLLISVFDIKDVEDNHKDELAYTKANFENERIEIYINFKKIEDYQLIANNKEKNFIFGNKEILFIIFHELLHHYLYHFTRFKENNLLINIVTDFYVNSICKELLNDEKKVFIFDIFQNLDIRIVDYDYIFQLYTEIFKYNYYDFPSFYELRDEWIEERLYELFLKKKEEAKINSYISDWKKKSSDLDNHDIFYKESENLSNSKKDINNEDKNKSFQEKLQEIYNKIKNFEIDYETSSKTYGKLEVPIYERKKELLKADYFLNILKLKRIITKSLNTNVIKTYKTLNRKRQNEEIVFKGNKKVNGYKLIVAIDVSGSITENDLEKFINMLYGLNKKKKDYLFDIIYWSDNDIKKNQTYFEDIKDIKEFVKKEIYSTGGTDISYLHNYLNERYEEPIEVVNITDGYFEYDKKLNKNILKYHFVLTEKIDENFSSFYLEKRFSIVSIKN